MKQIQSLLTPRRLLAGGALLLLVIGIAALLPAKEQDQKDAGYLGVSVSFNSEEDGDQAKDSGVVVVGVDEDGPAQKAGIRKHDVLRMFNDRKIARPDDLVTAVHAAAPGEKVRIRLVRDEKPMDVTVTLGKRRVRRVVVDEDIRKELAEGLPKWTARAFGGGIHLGVYLQELNPELAEYFQVKADDGALVLDVEKNSAAQKAGIKGGDVIVQIGERNVHDPDDVRKFLSRYEKGEKVAITVVRHGQRVSVNAELQGGRGVYYFGDQDQSFSIPDIHIPQVSVQIPRGEWSQNHARALERVRVEMPKKMVDVQKKLERMQKELERNVHKLEFHMDI